MGKNRDLDLLIRLIVNTVVHEIVVEHTNRPESKHFLQSEIIEYRSQAEEAVKVCHWNYNDRQYVENKALIKIKEKLSIKYSDVVYPEHEIITKLKKTINEMMSETNIE